MAYQVAVGASTVFYIGKQSARGTPQEAGASMSRHEIISLSIEPVITDILDPSLHSGVSERAVYSGGVSWQGTLKIRANYEGLGIYDLLGAVVGTNTTGTVTESENGGYWTMLYNRGGMETTPLFEQLSDVRFTGFTFKCAAGTGAEAMGTFEFTFVGSTFEAGHAICSGTPPTAPAANPVLFHQATVALWHDGLRDGASPIGYRPKSVEISYKVPLEPSNFIMTSATSLEPSRTGPNTCEWKFEESLMSVVPITAAKTGAVCSYPLTVTFASTGVSLCFTSTTAKVSSYSGPVEGYGEVREVIGWKAYYNSTDGGALKITSDYTA